MARLPDPGGDEGLWGLILNSFLSIAHNDDGTIKDSAISDSGAALKSANLSDLGSAATARTNLGLGSVDDTSDVNKPISTAAQAALDDKIDAAGSSTDMAIPRFDGATGNALQDSGWVIDDAGDVTLPDGTVSGGQTSSGRIMNANQLRINWDYNQTDSPADDSYIGSGVVVNWTANVSDNFANLLGPRLQSVGFGPRGVFQIEGLITAERNLSQLSPGPIGFSNQIWVRNEPGQSRTLVPDWGFMNNWQFIADGAAVNLNTTDSSRGGAGFIDNQVLSTMNGGTMSGTANNYWMYSFLSHCFVMADVTIPGRYGYVYHDLNDNTIAVIPGVTPVGTVGRQEAFHVPHLTKAGENIGLNNGSSTINPPQPSTISGASSTVRIDSSTVTINNTSGGPVTLTSTPTIANGYSDGHTLTLINTSANAVTLQGESSLANSNIAKTVTLNADEAITLVYANNVWSPLAASTTEQTSAFVPEVMPTGAIAQTLPRWTNVGNLASLASGTLVLSMVRLQAGQTVNSITWVSRSTALVGGNNQWFGLFNSNRQCLAVTNDDTSTAWGVNTAKTLSLTAPYAITTTGNYYIGVMVNATTPPTLAGLANATALLTGIAPILVGTSNTAQTTPFTVGNTANALTALGTGVPYAYVS